MISTGHSAWRLTFSAVVPRNQPQAPDRPLWPSTIRSAWWLRAAARISWAGCPVRSSVDSRTPNAPVWAAMISTRPGYRSWFLVALVVAVAQRRLGPSSSATTSTTWRALPSSAVQLRCWSQPTTTRLPPLVRNRRPKLSKSASPQSVFRVSKTPRTDVSGAVLAGHVQP
jgi:hypothetical protein